MPRPQSSESQPFPLPILPCPDIPVGGRLAHFVRQWGELTQKKNWSFLSYKKASGYHSVQLHTIVPISLESILREEITELLQKRAVERVQDPGTQWFLFPAISCPEKEQKVMSCNKSFNQYIKKQLFKMETVK